MLAVVALVGGPWFGQGSRAFAAVTALEPSARLSRAPVSGQAAGTDTPLSPALSSATGCSCREVVVDVSNEVRDADIRTGDAEVENESFTYIAPTFGDDEVEIDQEADAVSGDAIAGQILAVDGGPGCSRVRVTATNIVEDSELRTGDAVARNKSLILLDPRINREDLEIEVDQEANARSGDAIAGQIIGVNGGGPCGGVIVEALNRVRNVELRTGEAITENDSDILTCRSAGCAFELRLLFLGVEAIDVCGSDGCRSVPKDEFIQMLKKDKGSADADDDDEAEELDVDEKRKESLDNPKIREAQPWRYPRPRPRRTPAPTATDTAVEGDEEPAQG